MRPVRVVLVVCLCAMWFVAPSSAGASLYDDVIPGKLLGPSTWGWLNDFTDVDDVFRVYLLEDQRIEITMTGPVATDFDLYLYVPWATGFGNEFKVDESTVFDTSNESISYVSPLEGWFYLRVNAWDGSGSYHLSSTTSFDDPRTPATPHRLWGQDRYETAVEIARENFPNWARVKHVIIASGEDRAAADPLAASGLVWAYGAPIFLVRSNGVPDVVMNALKSIKAANGSYEIHVVGGPVSVPDKLLADIALKVGGVSIDRIAPYADRYTLAASIARRMQQERPGEEWGGGGAGMTALIANGENPDKFFDALALSPIAARNGFPILLVRGDSIPIATKNALTDLGLVSRTVAGGPNTVSEAVLLELGAGPAVSERWSGRDRYETAVVIMNKSMDLYTPDLVSPANIGVAAKLPDALTGGAFIGQRGGCILIMRRASVPDSTTWFLREQTIRCGECFVFGGVNSVTDGGMLDVGNALATGGGGILGDAGEIEGDSR